MVQYPIWASSRSLEIEPEMLPSVMLVSNSAQYHHTRSHRRSHSDKYHNHSTLKVIVMLACLTDSRVTACD